MISRPRLLKTAFITLAALLLLSACSTTKSTVYEQPVKIQEFDRDEYVVLDKVTGEAKSLKLWLLFIPFGGKADQVLYEKAYENALELAAEDEADGILQPRYSYKKTSVPLILFGWTSKKVTAEGKAFRIKSEAEYQRTRDKN